MKKAFDTVNFYMILRLLLLRGIPKSVVSLILTWYESTDMTVVWQNQASHNSFGIKHGVRQGGLLSPALFAVLIDTLLAELEISGAGCRIGPKFFGAIAYADDLVLMSPSVDGLNTLLSICSNWSKQNNLSFNPAKSQVTCFSNLKNRWPAGVPIDATLDGLKIPTFSEV
jgi:hypothetical protein